jgi:hypothetical protein
MASPFLENLKKSVETGEFNSDAAKKIIELDKLAGTKDSVDAIASALEKGGVKTVSEGEAAEINSDYEKNMQLIREKDLALQQLAMLKDIEETVRLSVYDMRDFLKTLEETFDRNNAVNGELYAEIDQIKNKYNSIINN